jgi:hypothetical protein
VVHNDDTGMRILKLVRNPDDERTGTFTSGIVSILGEWIIALYFTGWKHAGESLAEVLRLRAAESEAPIQVMRCHEIRRSLPACRFCSLTVFRIILGPPLSRENPWRSTRAEAGRGVNRIHTPDKASEIIEEL